MSAFETHYDDANGEYIEKHPNCLGCAHIESEILRLREELAQLKIRLMEEIE